MSLAHRICSVSGTFDNYYQVQSSVHHNRSPHSRGPRVCAVRCLLRTRPHSTREQLASMRSFICHFPSLPLPPEIVYSQAYRSGIRSPGTRLQINALSRPHLTVHVTSAVGLLTGLLVFAPRGKVVSQKLFLYCIFCESFAISTLILRSIAGLKDLCE